MPLPSNEGCGHGLPVLSIEGSLVGMGWQEKGRECRMLVRIH